MSLGQQGAESRNRENGGQYRSSVVRGDAAFSIPRASATTLLNYCKTPTGLSSFDFGLTPTTERLNPLSMTFKVLTYKLYPVSLDLLPQKIPQFPTPHVLTFACVVPLLLRAYLV